MVTKKVMIIDDEPGICDILQRLLTEAGYNVLTSLDPEEGLVSVDKEKPDCVLLDIKMPKMDGIDVLSRIKEIDKKIGVIMITGYGNIETAMESMKLGAFDYVTKPFELEFVKTLVGRCIEDSKAKV